MIRTSIKSMAPSAEKKISLIDFIYRNIAILK